MVLQGLAKPRPSGIPGSIPGGGVLNLFKMKHKLIVKRGERCKICTCGKSKIMPICDDVHRKLNEEKNTNYKSLKITSSEDTILDLTSSNWE